MRWKLVIGITVFVIASVISFQFIPEYIGDRYYQQALRFFYGENEIKEGDELKFAPDKPGGIIYYQGTPRFFYGEKNYKAAIAKFESARKWGTEKLMSTILIGFAYNKLEQYDTAVKYFQEALQIDPHNDDAGGGLVDSLIQLDKHGEAEKVALDRLSYLLNNEDACLELAKIYAIKKDFKKAKEYIDECVYLTDIKDRLDITDRVVRRFTQSHILYDLGDYEGVIKVLDEIQKLDPSASGVYTGYAESYDKLGNEEKALENWQKVISFNDPPEAVEIAKQRIQQIKSELKLIETNNKS